MTHLSLTSDIADSRGRTGTLPIHIAPLPAAILETLSIGCFLGVCLGLIAMFS